MPIYHKGHDVLCGFYKIESGGKKMIVPLFLNNLCDTLRDMHKTDLSMIKHARNLNKRNKSQKRRKKK